MVICQTINRTYSPFNEFPNGRSPIRLTVHEEKSCSTYSLLICFTIFHAIADISTLVSIFVRKHNLVLPLILILILNIVVSALFLFSGAIAYLFTRAHYDGYFVAFILAQSAFRVYELMCARRLYFYYQWAADERHLPQSSLLRQDDNSPFQF
jgi:hypothetical protein